MKKELTFIKQANRWFIHLPFYEGDPGDLEMVVGADDLCETLDKDKDGIVNVTIWVDEHPDVNDYQTLSYHDTDDEGTFYWVDDQYLIWLCSVLQYVLGKVPTTIYFYAYG